MSGGHNNGSTSNGSSADSNCSAENPALQYGEVIRRVREAVASRRLPSVSNIAGRGDDPYRILVSTIISLRTKDEVTAAAAERLFVRAGTPSEMLTLTEEEVQELIYPAGFYRNKARTIRTVSRILLDEHGGEVPRDRDALLQLPGVGLKTANLTLSLGYELPYICVDTHVHRIANRLGWVATGDPDATERELSTALPVEYRIEINELFVKFGQLLCTPQSPRCSQCPLADLCPRIGVTRIR
jgi:endonuclease-3